MRTPGRTWKSSRAGAASAVTITSSAAKFNGCLLGLALGDAFGAPREGGPLERLLWLLIGKTRDGCRRWTEDTQMSLDLAESLIAMLGSCCTRASKLPSRAVEVTSFPWLVNPAFIFLADFITSFSVATAGRIFSCLMRTVSASTCCCKRGRCRFGCRVHVFCFMSNNHLHLVLQADDDPLSRGMQNLSFRYTRWIYRREKRTGHLFQGRFRVVQRTN